MTKEAAAKNFLILKKYNFDLGNANKAQRLPPLGYDSEFKPPDTLVKIFTHHPLWAQMEQLEQASWARQGQWMSRACRVMQQSGAQGSAAWQASSARQGQWMSRACRAMQQSLSKGNQGRGKSCSMRSCQRYAKMTPLKATSRVLRGLRGYSGQGTSSGARLPQRHEDMTPLQIRSKVSTPAWQASPARQRQWMLKASEQCNRAELKEGQHGKPVQQDRDNAYQEHAEQCNRACQKKPRKRKVSWRLIIPEICKDDSIKGNFQGINRVERKLRTRDIKQHMVASKTCKNNSTPDEFQGINPTAHSGQFKLAHQTYT